MFKLYAAGLPREETRHLDLVAAILEDFARLIEQGRDIGRGALVKE